MRGMRAEREDERLADKGHARERARGPAPGDTAGQHAHETDGTRERIDRQGNGRGGIRREKVSETHVILRQ